jgi:gentisate 1,2-dioxygenase
MSEAEARSEDPRVEALHRRMAGYSLGGHWQHREQAAPLVPFVWTWDSIYECLMESGEVITLGHAGDAANRRTVQLVNPAITAQKSTTRTLQMSIQLVKPGELAECHRHSAAALRFIVESDGKSYTNVDGEQMLMEPGDLVLTPNWTWHDHHNPSETNVVWLDVLDVHLAKYLDAMYGETYSQGDAENANYFEGASQTVVHPDGYCRQRFGVARPPRDQVDARFVPYNYKWRDTLATLKALAEAGVADPHDGILLDYKNPLTGGPTMPTINCRVQMLRPGEETRPHSHTSSTIYHVVEGEGLTSIAAGKGGNKELAWGTRDCFFVPSKSWHSFKNTSQTDAALLFSVSDRPVLESLGLYREEGA